MDEQEWFTSTNPASMLDFALGCRDHKDRKRFGFPITDRKMRLFACACCRQVWESLTDSRSRNVVEVAERYADNVNLLQELSLAFVDATMAFREIGSRSGSFEAEFAMCTALRVDMLTENTGLPRWLSVSTRYAAAQADLVREIVGNPFRKSYPMWDKLRSGDVVPRASALSVLTPTVLSLAQAAYEERMTTQCYGCIVADNVHQVGVCSACDGAGRIDNGHLDPHRLGVLADALEEAGCEDQHCPHCVGGVWGEYESGEVIQCNCRHTALLSHLRGPGPHVRGCWALDLILGNV